MPGAPYSQPGGGFWRSLGGGLLGGMLGGMLFRSLGFGGFGGLGGGGFGLMDLLILAGIGYVIFSFVRRNRTPERAGPTPPYREPEEQPWMYGGQGGMGATAPTGAESGVLAIRRTDPGFDEAALREWCTDTFFRIQACWMHRDLEGLRPFLTPETYEIFRGDIEALRSKGQSNRLENITVRSVDLVEAWQEQGLDYVTVRYVANLLDYTVEDGTGRIVSGSDREPVKFEELWTWARPSGPSSWRLAGIQQME